MLEIEIKSKGGTFFQTRDLTEMHERDVGKLEPHPSV